MKSENRDLPVWQVVVRAFGEASSLTLPPKVQWGSSEPPKPNYKGRWTARTEFRLFERGCGSPTRHADNESWKIYSGAATDNSNNEGGKIGEKMSLISSFKFDKRAFAQNAVTENLQMLTI